MLKEIDKSNVKSDNFKTISHKIGTEKYPIWIGFITLINHPFSKVFIIYITTERSMSYIVYSDARDSFRDKNFLTIGQGLKKFWEYFPEDAKSELVFYLDKVAKV